MNMDHLNDMEDIKSGKGLPPLSSGGSSNHQSGITMEQRAEKGITYKTSTYHGENNSDKDN